MSNQNTVNETELSVRDYFAAKVMHALMTEPIPDGSDSILNNWTKNTKLTGQKKYAFAAYLMADAMLEARKSSQDEADRAEAQRQHQIAIEAKEQEAQRAAAQAVLDAQQAELARQRAEFDAQVRHQAELASSVCWWPAYHF